MSFAKLQSIEKDELDMSDAILKQIATAKKNQIRVQPQEGGIFTVTASNQPKMTFILNSRELVNLSKLRLSFTHSITGGTTPALNEGGWSAISRVRLLMNSFEILNIEQYNLFESIFFYATASNSITNTIAPFLGVQNLATRQANAAGKRFYLDLFQNYAPNKLMDCSLLNSQIIVEIYPESPNACTSSATAVTNCIISNPELVYDEIIPSAEFRNEIKALLAERRLKYHFSDSNFYVFPCSSTNNQLNIPEKAFSLRKVIFVFRDSTEVNDGSIDNKLSRFKYQGTPQSYQIKLNSTFTPLEPLSLTNGAPEAYFALLKNLSNPVDEYMDEINISYADYTTNNGKFVVCHNLENAPSSSLELSGADLSVSNSSLQLIYKASSTAANQQAEIFCVRDVIVTLEPNGSVTKME